MKDIKRLGKLQKHALNFCVKYEGWHSFNKDKTTKRVILSLHKRKLVVINEFGQFAYNPYND